MIRLANHNDLMDLLDILKHHYYQMQKDHPEFAVWRPPLLHRTLRWAIDHEDWLVLTDAKVRSILIASKYESPFGIGSFAQEHILRVEAPNLFEPIIWEYLLWAEKSGCRRASIGCIERFKAFERLLRPMGFRLGEMMFVKDLV